MNEKMIRVAITHGDTNGIGYELILKTFQANEMLELCTPIVYGAPKVAAFHRNALGIQTPYTVIQRAEEAKDGRMNMLAVINEEVKVEFGSATEASDAAALKAVAKAKEDAANGLFDVLVKAPVADKSFDAPLPMLISDQLRMAMVTTGLPLKDVPRVVTKELIEQKALLLHQTLRRDFRISKPRIAILAMNIQPGEEEEHIIQPAIFQSNQCGKDLRSTCRIKLLINILLIKNIAGFRIHNYGSIAFNFRAFRPTVIFGSMQ